MLHGSGNPRFRDDDGSADPAAAAALSAFAAAQGSEHAALTALAQTRLLVPVVAVLSDDDTGEPGPAAGGEKNSEMAMPTLLGRDGRAAIPVFTGLDALARWQPSARPVPAEATQVWQAAVQDLLRRDHRHRRPRAPGRRRRPPSRPGPGPARARMPYEDPDIHEVVAALVAQAARRSRAGQLHAATRPRRRRPAHRARAARGHGPGGGAGVASQVGSAILERLGHRLRRGIALALAQP